MAHPKASLKQRITIDCEGYQPSSIRIDLKNGQLVITGREEFKDSDDNFSIKEFKRTLSVPKELTKDDLVTYFNGKQIIIEFNDTLNSGENKFFELNISIPKHVDPKSLAVQYCDRDLIVQANENEDQSKLNFFQRHKIPKNINLHALRCEFKENMLQFRAPFN